jgi:hypothetical protein
MSFNELNNVKYLEFMLINNPASGKILCRQSETLEGREAENLFEDSPAALRFCESWNNILPGALTFLFRFWVKPKMKAEKSSKKVTSVNSILHIHLALYYFYQERIKNTRQ